MFTVSSGVAVAPELRLFVPVWRVAQMLLRGCVLRNVRCIYGVVVYTGTQTKVRVKQTEHAHKRAQVEYMVNKQIIFLVTMLALCCVAGTIGYAVFTNAHISGSWYLKLHAVGFGDGLLRMLTFLLLNRNFIPVSLYVSMKLARTAQKFFMEKDLAMYYEDKEMVKATNGESGQFPMQVRTMDLNGDVVRILCCAARSDVRVGTLLSMQTSWARYHTSSLTKPVCACAGEVAVVLRAACNLAGCLSAPGTFTLNYMEFRKVCINGVSYGRGTTEIGLDRMRREHVDGVEELAREMEEHDAHGREVPHVNFDDGSDSHPDRTLRGDLQPAVEGRVEGPGTTSYNTHTFMLHLVLNHTVVPEKVRNKEGEVVETRLSASSPDEEAFVRAGEFFGYVFVDRSADTGELLPLCGVVALPRLTSARVHGVGTVFLRVHDRDEQYTVLHILAYNQMRKRMSVLVRDGEGQLRLYVKGADTVIMARLKDGAVSDDVKEATRDHLATWGNDGLRTLCFAYRDLDEEMYEEWRDKYVEARGSVEEIEKRKKKQDNAIDTVRISGMLC